MKPAKCPTCGITSRTMLTGKGRGWVFWGCGHDAGDGEYPITDKPTTSRYSLVQRFLKIAEQSHFEGEAENARSLARKFQLKK